MEWLVCCPFESLTAKIHFQPFSGPWGADHCGLHHPGSLALWLPVGFGHRQALAGGLGIEGERGQGVSFSIPLLLRYPSSDSGCLLYNCGFCQEALLPWLQLLLGSNNMFSSPCSSTRCGIRFLLLLVPGCLRVPHRYP